MSAGCQYTLGSWGTKRVSHRAWQVSLMLQRTKGGDGWDLRHCQQVCKRQPGLGADPNAVWMKKKPANPMLCYYILIHFLLHLLERWLKWFKRINNFRVIRTLYALQADYIHNWFFIFTFIHVLTFYLFGVCVCACVRACVCVRVHVVREEEGRFAAWQVQQRRVQCIGSCHLSSFMMNPTGRAQIDSRAVTQAERVSAPSHTVGIPGVSA